MIKRILLCVLVALILSGCRALTPQPSTFRNAIGMGRATLEQLEGIVPEDDEHREEGFAVASAALDLGEEAVAVWEREASTDPPDGWTKWITDALTGIAGILDIVKAAGVAIPTPILMGAAALQALLPAFL